MGSKLGKLVDDRKKEKIKQDGIVMVMNKYLSKWWMSKDIYNYIMECIEYKLPLSGDLLLFAFKFYPKEENELIQIFIETNIKHIKSSFSK